MEKSGFAYLIALTRLGLTSLSYIRGPLGRLGGPEAMFKANLADLLASGLRPSLAEAIVSRRSSAHPDEELALLARHGIAAIPYGGAGYPPLLLQIPDPPPILYARGNMAALTAPFPAAIVGTRKLTGYGRMAAGLLAGPLAAAGMTIVSGLALGIDAVVHAAVLDAHGLTVAVLGSGVDDDSIGPRTNLGLARRIMAENGAVVSEHPPGVQGATHHFPLRNRIIAGMSLGTIVVEAAFKSGALITARLALEYGRDVFAVPGPITSPTSAGTNALFRDGAIPALSADDIFASYGLIRSASPPLAHTLQEEKMLKFLAGGEAGIDDIAEKTGLPVREILATLSTLEICGAVTKSDAKYSLTH